MSELPDEVRRAAVDAIFRVHSAGKSWIDAAEHLARVAICAELRRLAAAFDVAVRERRKITDGDVPGLKLAIDALQRQADDYDLETSRG